LADYYDKTISILPPPKEITEKNNKDEESIKNSEENKEDDEIKGMSFSREINQASINTSQNEEETIKSLLKKKEVKLINCKYLNIILTLVRNLNEEIMKAEIKIVNEFGFKEMQYIHSLRNKIGNFEYFNKFIFLAT
jgi:hypothetical protein